MHPAPSKELKFLCKGLLYSALIETVRGWGTQSSAQAAQTQGRLAQAGKSGAEASASGYGSAATHATRAPSSSWDGTWVQLTATVGHPDAAPHSLAASCSDFELLRLAAQPPTWMIMMCDERLAWSTAIGALPRHTTGTCTSPRLFMTRRSLAQQRPNAAAGPWACLTVTAELQSHSTTAAYLVLWCSLKAAVTAAAMQVIPRTLHAVSRHRMSMRIQRSASAMPFRIVRFGHPPLP